MKVIKFTLALLFAAIFVLVPIIVGLVKFQNTLPLGKALKQRLIHFPVLVAAINLNEPGDARYGYIHAGQAPLSVTLAAAENSRPDDQLETWISQMVMDTTGNSIHLAVSSESIPGKTAYSLEDLNRIHASLQPPTPSKPVLNIVYLSAFADKPTYAGITLHRDTIFIFKQTMADLTQKQSELANFEHSTLLHEWGHLLGMNHTDFPNCIMAAEVEVNDTSPFAKNVFPTAYCWNELYELKQLHRKL